MKRDGISGRVGGHVENDRLIEIRPDETAYVRVTHFPYEDHYVDYSLTDEHATTTDDAHDTSLPHIPLGNAYEVSVWDGDEITDTYGPLRGATTACQQAIVVATARRLPIWETIIRLRPEVVVWEDEMFETVSGRYTVGVRPAPDEDFEEAHIAVDRDTGIASWGASRADALDTLDCDSEMVTADDRTGEIVTTDGVLGGDPRVDGSRIGVLYIIEKHEQVASVVETASRFSGTLTVDEVRAALNWADKHPEEVQQLKHEQELFNEWTREYWTPLDGLPEDADITVYHKPENIEVGFDEFKYQRKCEEN